MNSRPLLFRTILLLLLCGVMFGLTAVHPPAQAAHPESTATGMYTRNGIWLEAGLPLPVFRFATPQVSGDGALGLAQWFEGLGTPELQADSYLGNPRFTVLNESSNSLLEQYGATGGFYAYNPDEAFAETPRGGVDTVIAQIQACNFLLQNEMFPDNDLIGTPNVQYCDYDFSTNPYDFSLIHAANENGRGVYSDTVVGIVVQVPMVLKTGQFSQTPEVPLGGAGGHLSLLFSTTDLNYTGFSLDNSVPGLTAMSLPFYGRSANFLGNFPAVDPVQARQDVETAVANSFPTATNITVPNPDLLYQVGDAAQPQTGLEPMLKFTDIEVTIDGETLILRDLMLPAVQSGPGGYGPGVTITAPTNGSTYAPDTAVNLQGDISDGTAPYTYTWSLEDGTLLHSGTLATAGSISHSHILPAISHGGYPAAALIILSVTDNVGAVRQATVSLNPAVAPALYLPVTVRGSGGLIAPVTAVPPTNQPTAITAIYRFGVEAGSDYPPYGAGGSDLPGVIPDANGFNSEMLDYGWTRTFNWWNASAWEKDWRDCSLGGGDCSYGVDRVDFVYYAGHGGPGGLSMPSSVDSSWFAGSNARFQTVRWAGFASCQTLRAQWSPASAAPIRQWFNAFQGAHMLLGFNSNMADVAFGPRLVDNMRMPMFFGIPFPWAQRTIRDAWVLTAFEMNAGKPAYIYAIGTNGVNPVNNTLPMSGDPALGRPYPVASYHWVWWDE